MATPPPPPTLSPKSESKPQSQSPQSRKSVPFPWSHQETVALIQAYQEKWYSLKKGQLKAYQWEEVAVTVAARCGFDEPSKTATQCRHKIEKLRKRYRSELQKRDPFSFQYFQLMDQMERGPLPLNARPPIKSAPIDNYNNNADIINGNNLNPRYATMYSASADYHHHNRNHNNNNDGSDESDEDWNSGGIGYGVETVKRNKSKSINNILRGDVNSTKRVAMESERAIRVLTNQMHNGKQKQYYGADDSDHDDDEDEEEEEEEEEIRVEGGGGGKEVAAEIRGFAESFMKMENKKIEMMRETERYRLEMEKKRMEMILEAQRKIVDTIGRAFGNHKKAKMAQET